MKFTFLLCILIGPTLFSTPTWAQSAQDLINQIHELRDRQQRPSDPGGGNSGRRSPTQRELDARAERERRDKANTFNDTGVAAWDRGEWGIAGEQFQQAYMWNPDSKVILTNLANARHKQGLVAWEGGDWELARTYFQSACLHNPKSKEFAGKLALAEQKVKSTRQDYERRRLAANLNNQGDDAWKRRDFLLGLELFKRALEADPDNPDARFNVAVAQKYLNQIKAVDLNNKGFAAYEKGDVAAALAFMKSALDADPENAFALKITPLLQKKLDLELKDKSAAAKVQGDVNKFADELRHPKSTDEMDFISSDSSVVDLSDAKTLTLDPSKVKGTIAAAAHPTAPAIVLMKKSMNSLAKTLGWSAAEQKRLALALEALGDDGNEDATLGQVDQAWTNIQARENNAAFGLEAAKVNGVEFPGAGTQSTNDCTIFALANATGMTYGGAAARATKLIREGGWRDPSESANPEIVFKKGLYSHEVIMLAEAFGEAEIVASPAFTATLKEGRPILLSVSITEIVGKEYRENFHEVVLTKSFQYKGETWFEMMDSNQPVNARRYLSATELSVIMVEKGVAFRPESKTTTKMFR